MNLHAFKMGAKAHRDSLSRAAAPHDNVEVRRCWLAGWDWQESGGKKEDIPGVVPVEEEV